MPDLRRYVSREVLELIVLLVLVLAGYGLSIADFFHVRDLIPFVADNTAVTLFILSTLGLYLVLERGNELRNMSDSLKAIQTQLLAESATRIPQLFKLRVNENLQLIFGEHIASLLGSLEDAIGSSRIMLKGHELDLFPAFYKRTLEKYRQSTFLATALPSEPIWQNPQFNHEMKQFIRRRGRIRRIFFADTEMVARYENIFREQDSLGVEVYISDISNMDLLVGEAWLFVVESTGRIGWKYELGRDIQEIKGAVATADLRETRRFASTFDLVINMPTTRRYKRPTALAASQPGAGESLSD